MSGHRDRTSERRNSRQTHRRGNEYSNFSRRQPLNNNGYEPDTSSTSEEDNTLQSPPDHSAPYTFHSNGFQSNGFQSNGFQSNGFQSNGFQSNGSQSNGFRYSSPPPTSYVHSQGRHRPRENPRQRQHPMNIAYNVSSGQHDTRRSSRRHDQTDIYLDDQDSVAGQHGSVASGHPPRQHRPGPFLVHREEYQPHQTNTERITISPISNFTTSNRRERNLLEQDYRTRSGAFIENFDTHFNTPRLEDGERPPPRSSSRRH